MGSISLALVFVTMHTAHDGQGLQAAKEDRRVTLIDAPPEFPKSSVGKVGVASNFHGGLS